MKGNRYIIIDDDLTSVELTKMTIQNSFNNAHISTYSNAEEALNFLSSDFKTELGYNTIILLDLDMPQMNGWNFLEHYDLLSDKIKDRVKIIIVSGYDNVENRKRAYMNRYVTEFIVKNDLYKNFYFRISKHLNAA
ncbi:hypothetical protein LBMAG27_24720 [Bacteroidota bacterium]|nr:hypothetical protein LBMAG27_24720 [Bacteroidota bacterium]